ncbi:MAG: alpha/beta hydrolase [Acidobacteriota bacterium]
MEMDRAHSAATTRVEIGGWSDWGGSGPTLHFAHANGFPSATYRKLFENLAGRHHVVSMDARPLWPGSEPVALRDWWLFADDLNAELDRRGLRGIVGIGHSLGAATSLLAAAADPGLFSAVVAIDPLLMTGFHSLFWGAVKALGLQNRFSIVRGARRRRRVWSDRQEVRAAYSTKSVFASWDPAVLDDYVAAGTVDLPQGGVRLRYPREWEARIFAAAPHDLWNQLRRVSVPTLFVQGEHSDTFLAAARMRGEREVPGSRTVVVSGASHFLPMEQPAQLARLIEDFLETEGL